MGKGIGSVPEGGAKQLRRAFSIPLVEIGKKIACAFLGHVSPKCFDKVTLLPPASLPVSGINLSACLVNGAFL